MNIVLTGSLGNISKPLAVDLIAKGHSVTVISSNPDKIKDIEILGAIPAIGAIEDLDFLTTTFVGVDAVYCMVPFNFAQQDQAAYTSTIENNYIQAIKKNKIENVVILGGWMTEEQNSPLLDKIDAKAITELRPSYFYSNFFNDIQTIKEYGTIMAGFGGEDKIAFVSPNDIATAALEELTNLFKGKKVRYVASEELTCNEVAKILGDAVGRPDLKWITLPEQKLYDYLIQGGFPEQLATNFVQMHTKIHRGEIFENYLKYRPELGQTKLKAFAQEFASVYNQH